MKFKLSIRVKLATAFILLTIAVTTAVGSLTYCAAAKVLKNEFDNKLKGIASASALIINSDQHALFHPGDEKTIIFKQQLTKLLQVQKNNPDIAAIYTMAQKNNTLGYFVLDTSTDPSPIGEEYELEPEMREALQGKIVNTKGYYTDKWGTYKSAYAPIFNGQGRIVAFLGVDISADKIASELGKLRRNIFIFSFIASLFALTLSIFLARYYSKPLQVVSAILGEMAEAGGDLTKRIEIKTGDEIEKLAHSTNKMLQTIQHMISSIYKIAQLVLQQSKTLADTAANSNAVTEQVAKSSAQLATGAEEQANGIENAVLKLNDIANTITNISVSNQEIVNQTQQTKNVTIEGQQAVANAISQMERIKKTVEFSAQEVQGLGERSGQIAIMLDMIKNISEQTNLLALNAAIEAARAGENGRGFTVVAEEIRKLAEQSKGAAQEITQLVTSIQAATEETVDAMSASTTEVQQGMTTIQKTDRAFQHVLQSVEEITVRIAESTKAIQQIADSSRNVAGYVEDIKAITEETAASTEEIAASIQDQSAHIERLTAASQAIEQDAGELQDLIAKFKF
ncbi:HAMP domain-containing methyl-accepting chemotaxis protein [Bacillota bacterium LX-D]|nr:HAMP domain-containing methyl-accepting chemotaxis protein [Bacillota bacterium LX-D]